MSFSMSQYGGRRNPQSIRDLMAKIGYARVSSVGQSLDVQREKLSACDKLFEEKRSGTTDARPQLKECLNYVRDGDQLIVTRIDRLARSTLHLCQIAETLRKKGVDLVVIDQNIDTSDATGRLLFNMLGAIGQFETEIRAERQMDGIKKAKDRGVQFGKRPALTDNQIAELRDKRASGTLIKDLMAEYSLSKATIYRYLAGNDA
ncbi:recombinase family protein [uncultured Sulfitobacter sp.]|uniref:recombinase family protein n=1 Tax=uncultured Sulfitobacter sp. TaxID=191468 RepID=UPI002604ADA0|nr:recombinase family protein [uncultured Sulfitobacter sp.]